MARVQIVFVGEPFNRDAVIHTLRHLAMRVGWQLTTARVEHRIVYATTADANAIDATANDIVILSSRAVAKHLETSYTPIPLDENHLPFPQSAPLTNPGSFICADVIAGAFAAMNLWYEERTRTDKRDGWIAWRDDWMAQSGFVEPQPLADQWLNEIARAAERLGWQTHADTKFTVVLTHDVDYLPSTHDFGLPRFARALARQLVLRHRPLDALALVARFARTWQQNPYDAFDRVMREEQTRGARSSFQMIAARKHQLDPDYTIAHEPFASTMQKISASDWEICLHGSYAASRTSGELAQERADLERVVGAPVVGHRQHYLNFHPSQLFDQVERAGLQYDSSVGYNDKSGPRAGTFFPYRPFAHNFWEIPFVLMDTTLATTRCLSPRSALEHSQKKLERVEQAGGCVSIIWHLEQFSGLLDPGYDQVYFDLLDWIQARGGAMTNGRATLRDWDARWRATLSDE